MSALGNNINYNLLHIQVDATLYNYYLLVLRFFISKLKILYYYSLQFLLTYII